MTRSGRRRRSVRTAKRRGSDDHDASLPGIQFVASDMWKVCVTSLLYFTGMGLPESTAPRRGQAHTGRRFEKAGHRGFDRLRKRHL